MKNEKDDAPLAAQISQYRLLWEKLLSPLKLNDETANKTQKTETAEGNDQEGSQAKTNKTTEGDIR